MTRPYVLFSSTFIYGSTSEFQIIIIIIMKNNPEKLLLIKRNGVKRNNTYENDNPSTQVITGKTAKALNELVKTASIL